MAIEFDKSKVYLHDTGYNLWVATITGIRKDYVDYEHSICTNSSSSNVLYRRGFNSLGEGIRLATEEEVQKANSLLESGRESFRFPSNNLNTLLSYEIY